MGWPPRLPGYAPSAPPPDEVIAPAPATPAPDALTADVPAPVTLPANPWPARIAEAAVLLGLAFAASRGLGWQLPGLELPHLVVAVVATRMGFVMGMGTGVAAAAGLLLTHGHAPQDFLDLTVARTGLAGALAPMVVGTVLGLITDVHRQALARAKEAVTDLRQRHDHLRGQYEVVAAAKSVLDRRVVGQVQTISAMSDAARALESLEPGRVLPAAVELVGQFLEANAAAIYVVDGFRLRLVASLGERADRPELVALDDPVLGTVVRANRTMAVRTREEYARAGVLLAAPIGRADGQVSAVIAVERLPFAQLTPATQHLLELVADWTGRALAKSEAFAASREAQADHPVTGALRVGTVLDRLNLEWELATRYGAPLGLLLVREPALLDAPPARRAVAAVPLVLALRPLLGKFDLLGHYRTDDAFLAILPRRTEAETRAIGEALQARRPGVVAVATSNMGDVSSPEAALQLLQVLGFELDD